LSAKFRSSRVDFKSLRFNDGQFRHKKTPQAGFLRLAE